MSSMPIDSRPIILINGELNLAKVPSMTLATRYASVIEAAGGVPLALPPIAGAEHIAACLAMADGVLLAGGDDFDTEAMGQGPTHASANPVPAKKQSFDLELARQVMAADLPVLGICYGMQLLALADGGALLQHLPEDRPEAQAHSGGVIHGVQTLPGCKLEAILGTSNTEVVSRHHQALSLPGDSWAVSAVDEDGLIEAIERPEAHFAAGVQWHPELTPDDRASQKLFSAFIQAARERRTLRNIDPVLAR